MWAYQSTDELYHHGVKGQRWGIRRYQNKDGSLTAAGRKRAAKLEKEYTSLTGRKPGGSNGNSGKSNSKNKSIKEMSNQELQERANRLNLENNYINAKNTSARLNPQKVSLGKRIISHLGKNVILPAATESGKKILTDWLTKKGSVKLGLNEKNPLDSLEDEVKELKLERNKLIYQNDIKRYKTKK